MAVVSVKLNWEFQMAVPSIFSLLLLSNLVILHSAGGDDQVVHPRCPKSFDCGNHAKIGFPLFNNTYPRCGLCMVNCSERVPKVQLGWRFFEVVEFVNSKTIKVRDQELGSFISSRSCDVFGNLSVYLLNMPSISFTVYPTLTLFKCTTTAQKPNQVAENYFRGNYNYRDCSGYTIYYDYPNKHQVLSTRENLPPNCSVIHIPSVSSIGNEGTASNLFSLLVDEFSVNLKVSSECIDCHSGGGICPVGYEEPGCIRKHGGSGRLPLILGTGISTAGIMTIVLFCYLSKCSSGKAMIHWRKEIEILRNVEAMVNGYGPLATRRYSYAHVKKMTNSFKETLGQGGYGKVYKGELQNGTPIAVKVLKELKGNGEEFINEVASISRTSHINIVSLLGFCLEGHKRALIYEFMPNGSLDKFLHNRNPSGEHRLGWEKLYEIALGTARGLAYLHRGCKTRILHFDIKPHNILLDEDFCPKISDFGLATLCLKKESIISMLGTRGTAGYIAPEVFCRRFGGVSHKSDVYSFGMMILEMVEGRNNSNIEVNCSSEMYFPDWIYGRLELDNEIGQHGIMNEEENERVRKMMIVGLWCVQTDPLSRPEMSRVVDMLEGSLESLRAPPPRPLLSSPPREALAEGFSTSESLTICSSNVG